jgi:hypothetical protein
MDQLRTLHACAAGRLRMRETIERALLHDYAHFLIALAENELDLPKPAATPLVPSP